MSGELPSDVLELRKFIVEYFESGGSDILERAKDTLITKIEESDMSDIQKEYAKKKVRLEVTLDS